MTAALTLRASFHRLAPPSLPKRGLAFSEHTVALGKTGQMNQCQRPGPRRPCHRARLPDRRVHQGGRPTHRILPVQFRDERVTYEQIRPTRARHDRVVWHAVRAIRQDPASALYPHRQHRHSVLNPEKVQREAAGLYLGAFLDLHETLGCRARHLGVGGLDELPRAFKGIGWPLIRDIKQARQDEGHDAADVVPVAVGEHNVIDVIKTETGSGRLAGDFEATSGVEHQRFRALGTDVKRKVTALGAEWGARTEGRDA